MPGMCASGSRKRSSTGPGRLRGGDHMGGRNDYRKFGGAKSASTVRRHNRIDTRCECGHILAVHSQAGNCLDGHCQCKTFIYRSGPMDPKEARCSECGKVVATRKAYGTGPAVVLGPHTITGKMPGQRC